jgi:hypothetical protein
VRISKTLWTTCLDGAEDETKAEHDVAAATARQEPLNFQQVTLGRSANKDSPLSSRQSAPLLEYLVTTSAKMVMCLRFESFHHGKTSKLKWNARYALVKGSRIA